MFSDEQAPALVIEDKVLVLLARDKLFGCAVIPYLDESLFVKPQGKLFFQLVKQFYKSFGVPPSFESCVNEAQKRKSQLDPEIFRSLGEFVYLAYAQDISEDADYVKQEISNFIQVAALRSAIAKSGVFVEQGKVAEIHREFEKARLAGAILGAPPVELCASVEDRIARRRVFQSQQKIPTGFSLLDNDLGGGLTKGELGVVVGGYGVGKSMIMQQFMVNAANAGKRCLYITLEMSSYEVFNRVDSNITGIPMEELLTREDDIRAVQPTLFQRYAGLVHVHEFPAGSLAVDVLPAIISQFNLMYGQLDVLFLDYADILKMNLRGDLRLDLKDIYVRLRGIASSSAIGLWTVSQVNRQGLDVDKIRGKHVNECIDKLFTADVVLSINQREDEYPTRARIWEEKVRRSRKWRERVVRCDLPCARITMHEEDQTEITPAQLNGLQSALAMLNKRYEADGSKHVEEVGKRTED